MCPDEVPFSIIDWSVQKLKVPTIKEREVGWQVTEDDRYDNDKHPDHHGGIPSGTMRKVGFFRRSVSGASMSQDPRVSISTSS